MADRSKKNCGCPEIAPIATRHLDHILVLIIEDDRGMFSSKILSDLGATIIRVETSAAVRDRALRDSIKSADVLIDTSLPGSDFSAAFNRRRLRRLNRNLIHISITPFGRTSTDNGTPPELAGCSSRSIASLFAAVAALLHLRKRRVTGSGSYVDLSKCEAVASILEGDLIRFLPAPSPPTSFSSQDDFTIMRTKDGYIQIPILRCWETLLDLLAADEHTEDLVDAKWGDPAYRREHLAQIVPVVEQWTRGYGRHELFELGQAMGFPWAYVESVEDAVNNPQLKGRNFLFSNETSPGKRGVVPRSPYLFRYREGIRRKRNETGGMGGKIPCADGKILNGTRILDLTRMISGPYATRILGDFGAEVIKIQSERTATGAEQNGSPQFNTWNRNKRSITLDLDRADARNTFLRLVGASDIVVENFSPRVMANWGLEYERLCEVNPRLIMVSISAMGRTGPWRNFVGFAPNFHALSGLISEFSKDDPPVDLGFPYADLVAGLYAALATLSALEERDKTGEGQHVDLSAFEAACTLVFAEHMGNIGRPRFPCSVPDPSILSAEKWVSTVWEKLQKRRFLVSLKHPVLGEMLSARTPLWNWRRKPNWTAAPVLGEHNESLPKLLKKD